MIDINSMNFILIIVSLCVYFILNSLKKILKIYKIEYRRKLLMDHGYVEIPYGFNPTKNEYSYGFKKGSKIISAVEIMTIDNGKFRKFLRYKE